MSEEKTISVVQEVYGFLEQISTVVEGLTQAQEKLQAMGEAVTEGNSNYQGNAQTEMYYYYSAMMSNVSKLSQLYALAQRRAIACIDDLIRADQELAAKIAAAQAGGGES